MGFISFVGHIKTGRLAEQSEVTKVGSHAVTGSWRQLSVHEGWSYFHAPARERGCRRNRYKCLIYNLWEKLCNKSSRATPRAVDDWFAPWERSIEISFLLLYFHLLPLLDQTFQWGMFGCSTELKSPMSDKCPGRKTSNGFISCLCRRRGRFFDAFYDLKCIFDKIALAACLCSFALSFS